MATIDNLCTSILSLPDEALFSHIKALRESRRTSKRKMAKKRAKKVDFDKILSSLTPEAAKQLIEKLEDV